MQFRGDSLWESFPQAIQTCEGAGRYINTFQAPFQELPPLSQQEVYTLQACSLLVIPPPVGRVIPQGGFPVDLTEINLWGWASLCKQLKLVYANCCKLVFSSSYAGCLLPCLLVLLFLRVGSLRLFWGMVVRGCARRDLC